MEERPRTVRTLIVLGSGGHTAELLALLEQMDPMRYSPRTYVVASTDRMGAQKARTFEAQKKSGFSVSGVENDGEINVCIIPRSREVGQSYLTSIWTTLVALWVAFSIVYREAPQLVLVNGPGTCIPICIAARFFGLMGRRTRIVYTESIARVSSLSLSGKILYHLRIADAFFVQWTELQRRFPRSMCCGRLF
ncbi:UDP-N-acetylglucosamine transferase subunit ALG14 homolog [Coccomyxa sp. Obi]|nr:UDP-N-acetylglucosamine transferase subunit ALG14 homolog [Coccomyxa sp. Obi]